MPSSRSLRGLYVVTDQRLGDRMEACVAAALTGGARMVQYRDKSGDAARRAREALMLRRLTRARGALLVVNDDPALAAAVAADGVHLGRDDPGIAEARQVLGRGAVIGVSCYASLGCARAAAAAGADYVAFGSVFASPTKPGSACAPLELFAEARQELDLPLCAIGGITPDNAAAVAAAGADLVAVVSSVMLAADPEAAARKIAARLLR